MMHQALGFPMMQGRFHDWTTFVITEQDKVDHVVPWCKANLGWRFRGFMHTAIGWGNWTYEMRSYYEIGLAPRYVKVFLRRPEDVALFKMRWS